MYWSPTLRVRPSSVTAAVVSPTPVSVVDSEQKHTVTSARASHSVHVPKIEIDLSGGSDDGDLDIDLPELEEFDETRSTRNREYKLPVAQGGMNCVAASITGTEDEKEADSTNSIVNHCTQGTSCSGLCITADVGVQTKHNRIFKVIPSVPHIRLVMSMLQQWPSV